MPTDLPLLRPAVFARLPRVAAAFTTRHGGVSAAPFDTLNLGLAVGDREADVLENRRRVLAALGFDPSALAVGTQVHADAVATVAAPGVYPGVDALVTATPGLVLAISVADCGALLLADAEWGVVGACHSGWRGTVAGIARRTVEAMTALGARPDALRAYIGPCISADRFEVGPEVAARFDARHVHTPAGGARPHVDLKAALVDQLRAAGVPAGAIEVSDACTHAGRADFFSYRADGGATGRQMALIGLHP